MNETAIVAFVIMPIVVVLLGLGAALLHEREARRLDRENKAADRG